jgi:hypothetical protein
LKAEKEAVIFFFQSGRGFISDVEVQKLGGNIRIRAQEESALFRRGEKAEKVRSKRETQEVKQSSKL